MPLSGSSPRAGSFAPSIHSCQLLKVTPETQKGVSLRVLCDLKVADGLGSANSSAPRKGPLRAATVAPCPWSPSSLKATPSGGRRRLAGARLFGERVGPGPVRAGRLTRFCRCAASAISSQQRMLPRHGAWGAARVSPSPPDGKPTMVVRLAAETLIF